MTPPLNRPIGWVKAPQVPYLGPEYLGPEYLGPKYLGPKYLGPEHLGPKYLGPEYPLFFYVLPGQSAHVLHQRQVECYSFLLYHVS